MEKNYGKYSDALKDLLIPRIKALVSKSDFSVEDCDKVCQMINDIKRALQQEEYGVGLF